MPVISNDNIVRQEFVLSGEIVSMLVSLVSLPIIAVLFWQRFEDARKKRWNVAGISLLASYFWAFMFVLVTTVFIHIHIGDNQPWCDATITTCLSLYVLSKASGFLFLIERVYIISWPNEPRHKTLEYVLNCVFIFVPYLVVTILCFVYRVAFWTETGVCIIGLQMFALLPLLCVEVLSYLYLALRFLYPLVMVHRDGQGLLPPLKRVMVRTTIGTFVAMISTFTVKLSLTFFDGEPAWLCCMSCKVDALISAIVLHWVTAPDKTAHQEQDTPQALGLAFSSDKGELTMQDTNQDSESSKTGVETPKRYALKDML
ncbi:hypothetical protein TI39_contig477g00004 [Zymoseptoria brevis]|uniref:Integral membrane protein n=1 Tax=Zymoseptoria brevis TaxID=1047168 RepID=A0A0F4GJP6_9PEZI|nr:hypothetical protein TI39_contig477g00004 [Zymoseptoria brevis]